MLNITEELKESPALFNLDEQDNVDDIFGLYLYFVLVIEGL